METVRHRSKLINSQKTLKQMRQDTVASQSRSRQECGDVIGNDHDRALEEMEKSVCVNLCVCLTLFSPSMTMTGTEVAGQRCLAGRGLSQFHRTMI